MTALTGAAFGALLGLGVFVVVGGVLGLLEAPGTGRVRRLVGNERPVLTVGLYMAAFIGVWSLTGWVVGGVIVIIVARLVPRILVTRQNRATEVAKIEAIAAWCEMMRDTISASSGLNEAIQRSAEVAPEPVRRPVRQLGASLRQRSPESALRAFADELDHPVGDLVVASLLLSASGQGGSMSDQLSELAITARANATMRLRIEAGRARVYTAASMVGSIFALFAVGLMVLQRDFMAAYSSATGQVVLLVVTALMLFGWSAMFRLGDFTPVPGVLRHDNTPRR